MSFRRSQIDLVKSDDRLLFVESKTATKRLSQKGEMRPRVGYVFAVAFVLIGCCLLPRPILATVSAVTIFSMAAIAFVFLIQMPVKMILADRYFQAGRKQNISPMEKDVSDV